MLIRSTQTPQPRAAGASLPALLVSNRFVSPNTRKHSLWLGRCVPAGRGRRDPRLHLRDDSLWVLASLLFAPFFGFLGASNESVVVCLLVVELLVSGVRRGGACLWLTSCLGGGDGGTVGATVGEPATNASFKNVDIWKKAEELEAPVCLFVC